MFVIVTEKTDLVERFEIAFPAGVPIVRESVAAFRWRVECHDIDEVTAVVFDLRRSSRETEETIERIVRIRRYAYLFAIIPRDDVQRAADLAHSGVDRCLPEQIDSLGIREVLLDTFSRYRSMCSSIRDVPELRSILVGRSITMQGLRERIRRVAGIDDPVVILGETGVGKELIAGAIHRLSERQEGPYRVVNVTTLVDTLFESEMFGVRGGAYTGATDSQGIFGAADGGTIFLDEIGDLPTATQPKLLRVIESGRYRRVGESQDRPISVRVVSATNRDLPFHVRAGSFRRDLWHRLAGVYIRVPALRDHIEDVEEIAYHILERRGCEDVRLSPGVINWFHRYAWPGNVRELATVLGRALLNADGTTIRTRDLEIDEVPTLRSEPPTGAGGYRTRAVPEPADLPGLLPD